MNTDKSPDKVPPLCQPSHTLNGLLSIQAAVSLFGFSRSTLYELIKTDPTFPFRNVGVKKRFMIDAKKLEKWIEERTDRQKADCFGIPIGRELKEKYRK